MMVLGWFGWEGHWPDPRMTLPLLSLLAAGELELLLLPHDTGAKMWERRIYEQTKSISWGVLCLGRSKRLDGPWLILFYLFIIAASSSIVVLLTSQGDELTRPL